MQKTQHMSTGIKFEYYLAKRLTTMKLSTLCGLFGVSLFAYTFLWSFVNW